jgi:hypothetical protein
MAYHLLARTKGTIQVGGVTYNYTPGDTIEVPDQFVDLARAKSKGTLSIIQKDGEPLVKLEPFTEIFVRTLLHGKFTSKDSYVKQAESYLLHLETIHPLNTGLIEIVEREFGEYPSVAKIVKRLLTVSGISDFLPSTEELIKIKERTEATKAPKKVVTPVKAEPIADFSTFSSVTPEAPTVVETPVESTNEAVSEAVVEAPEEKEKSPIRKRTSKS